MRSRVCEIEQFEDLQLQVRTEPQERAHAGVMSCAAPLTSMSAAPGVSSVSAPQHTQPSAAKRLGYSVGRPGWRQEA